MTKYYIRMDGPNRERIPADSQTLVDVKAEAVRHLGQVLMENPGFAEDGHWRMFVEDASGIQKLHVIVAMVAARSEGLHDDD